MSKWSSLKFKVAQELGDCMDCTYVFYNPKENSRDLKILTHIEHDGVSGLTELLPQHGFNVIEQPQLRDGNSPPSLIQRIRSLFDYIKLTKPVKTIWKNQKLYINGASLGFSYSCLGKEATQSILNYCKNNKISPTVFLMATLDRVVTKELLVEGSHRKWISPINMRGGVVKGEAFGNYSSSIIINADDSYSFNDWQRSFVKFLKKRTHWGGWLYTNMAKIVGESGTRFMAKRLKDVGVGVFSNMGFWPNEGITEPIGFDKNLVVIPSAPASLLLPVAAASSFWYGHLALSLRTHPSIQLSPQKSEQLHKYWLEEILKEVGVTDNYHCEFISREMEYH